MKAPALKTMPKVKTMIKREKTPFELIIIGGGAAGLTAGIYAKRAKIDTLLIEAALPGGIITSTELVENYPGFPEGISGVELGRKFEEQAKKYGLDIIFGKALKIEDKGAIKEVRTDEDVYSAKAIIIATGGDPKKLGIPGEAEFTGKGVSYCATCDGPFYKEKNVAVIGGGNAALEEAIFLTKFAKLVTVVHRREDLRADKVLQDKARSNPKIFFILNSIPEEIVGKGKVGSIKLKNKGTNKSASVDVDGVFIYAGHIPNSGIAEGLVKLADDDSIITDEKMATNVPGIFAAGDVRKKDIWQVVTAAADGAIAANSVKKYLENLK